VVDVKHCELIPIRKTTMNYTFHMEVLKCSVMLGYSPVTVQQFWQGT